MIEVIQIQEALQKRCERTGLLSAAMESVLTVVNRALLQRYRKFPNHDLLCNMAVEALKSERMFINGQSIAVVSLKK